MRVARVASGVASGVAEDRVAVLFDVHGNLPALEAALAAADAAGAGTIVFGGDLVPGPMPGEVVERVRALGPRARAIRGNGDRLVVDAFDGRLPDALPAPLRELLAWTAAQLDRSQRDFLAALPPTLALAVAGVGDVLVCHATPDSDETLVTARTPDARLHALFAGAGAPTVVCGHTHMPYDRTVGGVRVVNAGSVGLPFGAPGAHWLLLGPDVRPVRTAYDAEGLAARVRATTYPQPEEFLHPMGEAEALRRFAPADGSAGDDAREGRAP